MLSTRPRARRARYGVDAPIIPYSCLAMGTVTTLIGVVAGQILSPWNGLPFLVVAAGFLFFAPCLILFARWPGTARHA